MKASGVGVFDDAARGGRARRCGGRPARGLLGRRRAGDARRGSRRDPRRPAARARARATTSCSPTAAASRSCARYRALGARDCVPVYNALDPDDAPSRSPPDPRFAADLALPRQPAARPRGARRGVLPRARPSSLPERRFLLGGQRLGRQAAARRTCGYIGHVYTARPQRVQLHAARGAQRQPRRAWPRNGWSPATRVFEAAGAGACLDHRRLGGHRAFLEPGARCSSPTTATRSPRTSRRSTPARRARDRRRPRARRVLAEHTYAHRARAGRARSLGAAAVRGELLRIVILGLSITSSWGNGHATNYRGARARARRARPRRAVPRARRALVRGAPRPADAAVRPHALYGSLDELATRFAPSVARRRPRDRRLVRARGRRGRRVGARDARAGVTAFYDIDTPVTLGEARARRRTSTSSPALVPRFDLYLSFTGGPLLERLEREFGAARARPLYCSVDPRAATGRSTSPSALGPRLPRHLQRRPPAGARAAAARARARALPDARFVVAGPQYPDGDRLAGERRRASSTSPPAEHRALLRARSASR